MFKKLFDTFNGDNQQESPNYEQTQSITNNDCENEYPETQYDPETLHGMHYNVEDFDNEVASRAEAWILNEQNNGENLEEKDIKNIYFNYRRTVYAEWNNCDSDQMIKFEHANSLKYSGIQTSGFLKVDGNNPFLEPVHGIDLRTYTAMCLKISAGIDYVNVCKAMGFETIIWEELNTIWPQRMGEDTSFTVTTLFGQYYAENVTIPQLDNLKVEFSAEGLANLERINADRYFLEELTGARQAAYEYGIDGAQWILDNYGINLADFQSVTMKWMTEQNQNWNSDDILKFSNYQQEKQKEFAAKFAADQGGNIADDVEY